MADGPPLEDRNELPLTRREVLRHVTSDADYSEADDDGSTPQVGPTATQRAKSTVNAGSDPIPVRAANAETHGISIRAIAEDGENMSSPIEVSSLARQRGIDRELALRELVTSQTYDASKVQGLRKSSSTTWANWLGDYERTVEKFRPTDVDELRELLVWAVQNDKRVRAVGANHSHSDAATPDEAVIELSWYDDSSDTFEGLIGTDLDQGVAARPRRGAPGGGGGYGLKYSASNFDASHDAATRPSDLEAVRVKAGEMLKRLNRSILPDNGLGLMNMGAYDAQTVAGAVNTSTHGTGSNLGTFADAVLSVEMLTVRQSPADPDTPIVRHYRIEPSDGITERKPFEDNVGDHGMALIKDDDVFHAAVAGYGAMGVATSYTLTVRSEYFLREDNRYATWDNLSADHDDSSKQSRIQQLLDDPGVRHFSFLVNIPRTHGKHFETPIGFPQPTTNSASNPSCFVRVRRHESWKTRSGQSDWPPERTDRPIGESFREIRKQITGSGFDPTTPNPGVANLIASRWTNDDGSAPFKNPGGSNDNRYSTASYIALRRTKDPDHDNEAKPPEIPALAMTTEVAVPVEDVVDAVNDVIDEVQRIARERDLYFPAPLGVRFTAASEHHLSAEYEGAGNQPAFADGVAMLELPFPVGSVKEVVNIPNPQNKPPMHTALIVGGAIGELLPDRDIPQHRMVEYSKSALGPVERRLVEDYDGRPHMGKYNQMDCSDLADAYDRFETWHDVYTSFNAFGTFNNRFTSEKRLDVEKRTGMPPTTNCGDQEFSN